MKSIVLRWKNPSGPCCILFTLLYDMSVYVLCGFFRFSILAWELIREPAWGIKFVYKIPGK
uniref:Uncharacterized protein n=1 Tax=Mus musculus TaxID=10090 RepID=Q3UMW4_MOUSE|nr:unnamed protein product [Mus musculus]